MIDKIREVKFPQIKENFPKLYSEMGDKLRDITQAQKTMSRKGKQILKNIEKIDQLV